MLNLDCLNNSEYLNNLDCSEEYETGKKLKSFRELFFKIEELESCIRAALFLKDSKRAKEKEEELGLLRQEVKLIKDKQSRQEAYY